MSFAQNAAMLNFAAQEIDEVVGFGPRSPAIQIPKAPVPPLYFNNQNVSVSGGVIGSINLGTARDIHVHLETLTQNGDLTVADRLADLTNAVLNADDTGDAAKNELLEQIAFLTQQASIKPEERKPGMLKAIFTTVKEGTGAISGAAAAWSSVELLLKGHFGL
jgi:hypothetical protein